MGEAIASRPVPKVWFHRLVRFHSWSLLFTWEGHAFCPVTKVPSRDAHMRIPLQQVLLLNGSQDRETLDRHPQGIHAYAHFIAAGTLKGRTHAHFFAAGTHKGRTHAHAFAAGAAAEWQPRP
eukprot:1160891-Pelagomonas_calceolata.AAC.4